MPVFFNYRFYFKPEKKFTPHVNMALGMLVPAENVGYYSAIAMGFRVNNFSFSSGFSFTPILIREDVQEKIFHEWGGEIISTSVDKWHYPFGITIKVGFAF